MSDDKKSHIGLSSQEVGKYVLTPGDSARVSKIAERLKDSTPLAESREFTSYSGRLDGELITVISSGIGCPSTAICMEELIQCGAHTFIRIGTAGSYQKSVGVNDIIVSTGAIRDEGTTSPLVPLEFPAVADFQVLRAIWKASENLKIFPHFGITQTVDNLYAEFPGFSPRSPEMRSNKDMWIRASVLGVSMQAAAMFVIGTIRKVRAGEILAITDLAYVDEQIEESRGERGIEDAISLGIEALRILIEADRSGG